MHAGGRQGGVNKTGMVRTEEWWYDRDRESLTNWSLLTLTDAVNNIVAKLSRRAEAASDGEPTVVQGVRRAAEEDLSGRRVRVMRRDKYYGQVRVIVGQQGTRYWAIQLEGPDKPDDIYKMQGGFEVEGNG